MRQPPPNWEPSLASRRHGSGISGAVIFTAAVVLAIVVVPIVLLSREQRPAEPTPTPGVQALAGEIRTVPQLSPERKQDLIRQLAGVLRGLYEQAFVTDAPAPSDAPSPLPSPATRVDAFFTSRALEALRKDPDVFIPVRTLRVATGRVTFGGIATLEEAKPLQALLEVDFRATGAPANGPPVKLRQQGTILLVSTANGWRVDGFTLVFKSRPQVSPTPEPP